MKAPILCLLLISVLLVSCSKEDSDTIESNVWNAITLEEAQCADTDDNELLRSWLPTNCTAAETDCMSFEISFDAESGEYAVTERETENNGEVDIETDSGTYTITDNTISICEESNDCQVYTFTIDGNTMTWSSEGDNGEGCQEVVTFTKK